MRSFDSELRELETKSSGLCYSGMQTYHTMIVCMISRPSVFPAAHTITVCAHEWVHADMHA